MPDTQRGDFGDKPCTDCGKPKVAFKHWGPLVPPGEVGYLCFDDMDARKKYYQEHGTAKSFPEAPVAA
jgi:hypothetical protein